MLSGDLSFFGGGTIITIAGGGAALATASLVSAAMVVSFLDAFCWWGVCVCLLLFIQDIVVG